MQKLHCWKVNVLGWHFKVQKSIGISYHRVMFGVDHIKRNGVAPFLYFTSWYELSNSFSSDENEDCMR